MNPKLYVLMQHAGSRLHPISAKIATAARALADQKQIPAVGILFCRELSQKLRQELCAAPLDEIHVFKQKNSDLFLPQMQVNAICSLIEQDAEIFLVPATPEGRCVSAMVAARLHTGVTADCTSFAIGERGHLIQTRPAFSGNIMASIVTENSLPQIASLRFASPVSSRGGMPQIIEKTIPVTEAEYEARWVTAASGEQLQSCRMILVVGGGIRERKDLDVFTRLADKSGAVLCCSRMLTDRGWMPKSRQIGLSGACASAELMVTFGISGSVQFQAGLDKISHLIAVNQDEKAPIMAVADTPIVGDLYEIADTILSKL